MRRRAPRPLGSAVESLAGTLAPATTLARVQRVWPGTVGEAVAREASPVSERDGVVTVACASSVWAHELDLMAPELLRRLHAALPGARVSALRCVTGRRE